MHTHEPRSITVQPGDGRQEIVNLISATRTRILARYRRNFGADAEDIFHVLCASKLCNEEVWRKHFQPLPPAERIYRFLRIAANFGVDSARHLVRPPRTCDVDGLPVSDDQPSIQDRMMRAQQMSADRVDQVGLILVNRLRNSGPAAKFARELDAIAIHRGLRPLSRLRFISRFSHGGMSAHAAAHIRRILRDCCGWSDGDIYVYKHRLRGRFHEFRALLEGGALWQLESV